MTWMYHLSPQLSRRPYYSRSLFHCLLWPVRNYSQSSLPLLDPTEKLEEETLPWYSPERSYPVRIGEVFQSRYKVVGKLGYGGYSTIWLCRDLLQRSTYVTLKVFECDSSEARREISACSHLNSLSVPDHAGAKLIRTALDSFQITSAKGTFGCLVHPPLGMIKLTLMHLLLALDCLHTEAGIVHTDIQERNVMMGIEDTSILSHFEEEEKVNPSPRKIAGDREIYASRKLRKTKQHGRPTLCDFGQARFGSNFYIGDIQPYIYRAPEVILRMPWNEKVDIWNVGVLTWDIFQEGHLFYARDPNRNPSDAHHLAEMIALMGPPPKKMVQNSDYAPKFFDGEGNWKGAVEIPSISLEQLEGNLEGKSQQLFLQFLRKILKWNAKERQSARELLSDSWLQSS
ncbi:kinase-like domain-containing protein [Aspergillus welwitschiae]|uniref:non-specific serine/threonine protein kinase n=1 Tax=Aspergillus welwitschiae TaxID=1341132 RepID=A0A3F3PM64_9EURO|nr:kinase-like domain-containing protein [Aspergillus welwitschiae]RDH27928.1 kinase-like domain-containing protein [Aspergillus welwitschiae]